MGIGKDTAATIVTAVSLLLALATSRKEEPSVLVEELVDAKLVSQTATGATLEVLQRFASDKDQLKRSMRLGSLAQHTLPSFKGLTTSIDMRLEIKAGAVDLVVPTVVAHLQTDLDQSQVSFQLTKSDVEDLVVECHEVVPVQA